MAQSTTSAPAQRGAADAEQQAGLFIGSWEIGDLGMPGAPMLTVDLMFNAPSGTVTGLGRLSQAVSPPLMIRSRLRGRYTLMTVMPRETRVLISMVGEPDIHWPEGGGTGPLLVPNLLVDMMLDDRWESGTATFSYRTDDDEWHKVESVPVRRRASLPAAGQ